MEGIELLSFQMISFNGAARSNFVEAISAAKQGDFTRAEKLMDEGQEHFIKGHQVHAQLIQKEAENEGNSDINLLLVHAEDQMVSAEILKIMAEELIDIHRKIQ